MFSFSPQVKFMVLLYCFLNQISSFHPFTFLFTEKSSYNILLNFFFSVPQRKKVIEVWNIRVNKCLTLTLLIWMLSSCCCHCSMFSMRCTQMLMFPTRTDLPMSWTRLHNDAYSVWSSSLIGRTFCWSSRTEKECKCLVSNYQFKDAQQQYNSADRIWCVSQDTLSSCLMLS